MGASMVYQLGLRSLPMAGIKTDKMFVLSGFLNNSSAVYDYLETANDHICQDVYIYHGSQDTLVEEPWGRATFEQLKKTEKIANLQYKTLPFPHELNAKEMHDISDWLFPK